MYAILKRLVCTLFPLLVRARVTGEENFPPSGPYILATNHLSVFDLPLIMMVCPHTVRAFAASKHRRNPFYFLLLSAAGSIWVRRGEIDREALRGAFEVLKRGEVLGMAPEGTRARKVYALQPGKTGAAYIATRADVPIVPVGLTGTEKVKENLPRLRRTDVTITIGEPFRLPESGRVRGPKLDEYTDLIMRRIAALLPPEYRGVYG
ncbi:MAG: lysophospholipid acyltransferase family protein [Anaerolineae bacterium]|nr:1-acyl-sn-glycerol-3-phosphate acyltransferase [Anaerolineae bacterium]MDW8067300.1 lysophospholipid acyltransferase family protein [Anaerolineae bacterium]